MSLATMIAAHDDAALEALVSKGLVRRARRDLEAGLAEVSAHSDTAATVVADGQTVHVDSRGLALSRCTCPAGGVCRHVLLAVMALRTAPKHRSDQVESQEAPAVSQHAPSARAEVCALTNAELTKFAGADWSAAVVLADTSGDASIVESGSSCRVEFAAGSITVTFIAGQGLRKAAYKGPKSRTRLITAAAAIFLRSRYGVAHEGPAREDAVLEAPLAAEYLAEASATLVSAARIVLGGSSPIVADALFDLAISARAEAAPRLAAELHSLARMAGLAITRDVHFEPETFLAEAARTFALIEALRSDPANADLTGSLRRHYVPHAPFEIWMLGASSWRSDTGARGLTFYGFAPLERRWHSASIARAAGQDPSFDPKAAYRLPLWAAGQGSALIGSVLHIPEPLVASDGSIAITLPKPVSSAGRLKNARALIEVQAAHVSWIELRRDLARRFAPGLKRRAAPAPAMIAPARFGNVAFNELEQVYAWEVIDHAGSALTLTLPASSEALAQRLHREGRRICLILVEASFGRGGMVLRPISIASEAATGLDVVNLDLDDWAPQNALQVAVGAMRSAFSKNSMSTVPQTDALRILAAQSLAAATAAASGSPTADVGELVQRCQAAGFLTLATALDSMVSEPNTSNTLRTAYVAAEIQMSSAWM